MPWYDQPTRFGLSRGRHRGYIGMIAMALPASVWANASTSSAADGPIRTESSAPFVTVASASPHVSIQVSRGGSSLDCPDAAQIRNALIKHAVGNPSHSLGLVIEFQKTGAASVATIFASGAKSGARELRLETRDCQALLDPIVVSLTLLLDPDPEVMAAASEPSAASPATGNAASTPEAATLPFARARDHQNQAVPGASRDYGFAIDVGPALIAGLIPQVGYGLEIQGAASYRDLSLRVAAAGFAAEQLTYGDATVRGQTYFSRIGLCAQTEWRKSLELALCQATWLGQFSVKAQGFATDRSSEPVFWALGGLGEANVALTGPLGAYLRAGAFVPITQHRFHVDGFSGPVFQSHAFGAWLGTGVSWKFL